MSFSIIEDFRRHRSSTKFYKAPVTMICVSENTMSAKIQRSQEPLSKFIYTVRVDDCVFGIPGHPPAEIAGSRFTESYYH